MKFKSTHIKCWIVVFIFFTVIESCNYPYDVVVEQADGSTHKFICKTGDDTLNSTVYKYFEWIIIILENKYLNAINR